MTIFKKSILKAFIISVVVCAVYVLWVSPLGPFDFLSLKIIDGFYLMNNILWPSDNVVKDAVIVSIDDESFGKMGMRVPWPRGTIADMIEKIRSAEPAVICLDFVFFGESISAEDDLKLVRAIRDSGNVIAGS